MSDFNYGQAGQGALGGGMEGAAIGTAIAPGIGTLIGGGIGALGGFLGGGTSSSAQDYQQQLKDLAAKYGSTAAPQMGPASQVGESQFRRNQAGLIAQLEAMSKGQGPSAAALQMREAMDREAAAQASAAAGAGGRGVNAGAALRIAANNTAAAQAQSARDTGLMRVQEQLGVIGQLGNVAGQARAQDQATAQFNANALNQTAQLNMDAKLRAMGINNPLQLQALQMAMGSAGPGLGTQLLAGGASQLPGLLQYQMGQRGMSGGIGGGTSPAAGPVTSPGDTSGLFGQYYRPDL